MIKMQIITKNDSLRKITAQKNKISDGTDVQKNTKNDIIYSGEKDEKTIIVGIGASTGGPKALQEVLAALPGTFAFPVVVVQHMPPGFTKSLASRLDGLCELTVKEAEDGEKLSIGNIYIAPGDYHLKVIRRPGGSFIIALDKTAQVNGHRPSVDVMFESIYEAKPFGAVGVIMTGMGSDGVNGLRLIKKLPKSYIIAQDEATSTVFGMPGAAVKAGLADAVLPVNEISSHLLKVLGGV
jgi:two-component system chemotaxis response regulator CheB